MASKEWQDSVEWSLLEPLMDELPRDVLRTVKRRVDSMYRQLDYMAETEDRGLQSAIESQWSLSKIRVLCGLNSFYQIVLSPLASSARSDFPVGLVQDIPVKHGSNVFDSDRTLNVRRMMGRFRTILREAQVPTYILDANQTEDLIAQLNSAESNAG